MMLVKNILRLKSDVVDFNETSWRVLIRPFGGRFRPYGSVRVGQKGRKYLILTALLADSIICSVR